MKNSCLCIENYYLGTNKYPVFKKGNYYEYADEFFVKKYREGYGYNVSFSKGEYLFFSTCEEDILNYDYFRKYFRTLEDIRKEKLETLKEKINIIY